MSKLWGSRQLLSALMLLSALPFGVFAEELQEKSVALTAEEIPVEETPSDDAPAEKAAPVLSDTKSEVTSGGYTYSVSDGKATITGVDSSISGDVTIPSTLGGYPVTTIGKRAFSSCTSLTSVTIPNSVTTIGSAAFYYCTGLTSVTIPNSVTTIDGYAFQYCTGLTSITISDGVTAIGDHAFQYCYSLPSITIPDSVTTIGYEAFRGCTGLTSFAIPDSVTTIGSFAFHGTAWLNAQPDGVVYLKKEAYTVKGTCPETIILKDDTLKIASYAFEGCTGLTSIIIPDSVTSIGSSAFYGCTGLTSIIIPDSVTTIGDSAFETCTGLTSIVIPDSVTTIGNYVFSVCTGLTSVTIPNSVTSIGSYAFRGCKGLTSIIIPDSVTSIGDYAFKDCTVLADVWYAGDEAGRAKISIGSSNDYLTNATWHYNSCMENVGVWTHAYDNACDTDCNECGFVREDVVHAYDNAIDTTCNECGEIRALPYDAYGTTGECFWYLEGTVLTISGNGAMADYESSSEIPWGTSITEAVIEEGVTTVGMSAFSGCSSLAQITIPYTVTVIGNSAFSFCSSLKTVNLPDAVTIIGTSAFYGCKNLSEVTMPSHLVELGASSFKNCSSLKSLVIQKGIKLIYSNVFEGSGLVQIQLPEGIASIGASAFCDCASLKEIVIPNGVTTISSAAFRGCSSLSKVTLPESLTTMEGYVFYQCGNLLSINLPAKLTTISTYSFFGCSKLATVTLPEKLSRIDSYSFGHCYNFKEIIIPDTVSKVGNNAFYACSGIVTLTLGAKVETIGSAAFYQCTNLKTVIAPLTLKLVDYSAFSKCTALADVWYEGTATEHAGINTYDSSNRLLQSATWHYNSCMENVGVWTHAYDNACDVECNVCGFVREVTGHVYDNACDTDCNECGEVRIGSEHVFTDASCSGVCTICGTERGGHYVVVETATEEELYLIENSAYPFTKSGDWYYSTNKGKHKTTSVITFTAVKDCKMSLQYSVSSEGNYDKLTVKKNSSVLDTISGVVSGKVLTVNLSAGETLTFTYSKDSTTNLNADQGSFSITDCLLLEKKDISELEYICTDSFFCASCGKVLKESASHVYDNDCDYVCNICNFERVAPHVYDDVCDVTCNDCDFNRIPPHAYDNVCDATCNECGFVREVAGHAYDNRVDDVCNKCGETRILPYDSYGTTGSCFWYLEGTKLTIFGNGKMADYNYASVMPWGTDITEVIIEDGVTSVGTSAFSGCSSLEKVVLPDAVTIIGSVAFYGCKNLTEVTMPSRLVELGTSAFKNCSSLKTLFIHKGIKVINSSLFEGCSSLVQVELPEGITSIGDSSFKSCGSLKEIVVPNGVTKISSAAFRGCSSLTKVSLPESLTIIEGYVFYQCGNLTTINLPSKLERISTYTFFGCSKMEPVEIPKTVRAIETYAFGHCYRLNYVVIPDTVTSIGSYAFYSCSGIETLILGSSVTTVRDLAFYQCSKLKTIVAPIALKTVNNSAFSKCNALTDVWYEGTETDKSTIDTYNSSNSLFVSATWHYNSCMENVGVWTHAYDNACDVECNACGNVRTAPHVYDHSFDVDCNGCGAERIPEKSVEASLNLSVAERIYVNLWLDAEGVDGYKAEVGEDFTCEAFVTIGGERVSLGGGAVTGNPTVTDYGSYYIIRLSALPANHFDKTIEIVSPIFTLNTLGDESLNLLNLAKVGAEAGYDEKNTNLFKAIFNYGAAALSLGMLEMPDFVCRESNAPVYQKVAVDAINFTGMNLLMGDAIGIRLNGIVIDSDVVVTMTLNGEEAKGFRFDAEKGTLDVYVSMESVTDEFVLRVYTNGKGAIAVKTSIKGYTEAMMQKGRAELALAQLAQACANALVSREDV